MANILGIKTGKYRKKEIQEKIKEFYNSPKYKQIVTPNPEIILEAQKDEELFYILNQADISLADGFGLKIAACLSHQKLYRYTGADLLPYLLQEAKENNRKILIINRKEGLSKNTEINQYLQNKYPQISSLIIETDLKELIAAEDIIKINNFSPQLVISLLGAPYQEKQIFKLNQSIASLKLGIGLGGAFDFLTGKIKRAPIFMRSLGLEWLWRLYKQPKRWRRIWQATFIFLSKSLYWIFIEPHLYRLNVAVLIYKNTEEGKKILIVERQNEKNHWQIIQGGRDGLSIEKAGLKELEEETSIKDFHIIASFKNLYRYNFDKELGKYTNPHNNRHLGYKGQKQSLLIVEFKGSDQQIKINYWDHSAWRWVKEDDFIAAIHSSRQTAGKIYLEKLKGTRKQE